MPSVRNSATAQILADIPYPTDSVRRNAARVAAKKSEQRVNALVRTRLVKAEDVQALDLKQAIDRWAPGDLTREFLHENKSRFHFAMDRGRSRSRGKLTKTALFPHATPPMSTSKPKGTWPPASARVKVEHGAETANQRDLDTLLKWFDTQNAAKVAEVNFHCASAQASGLADSDTASIANSTNDDAARTANAAPSSRVMASSSKNFADSVLESDPEDGDDAHIQQVADDKARDARIRKWRDATAAF
ncbi:hypothetical protein GGX14DRAFT_573405 [Mycena pura]|uniref:Uncharacterized protein n=1 Tax=Mycena pura TaxID=153505 RepID=A0AAD6Y2W7_9AGAR|nr:hypothetical protein GGX14DRAFT_573405 [Mycena pura]